jgi:hypothetical protein
MSNLANQESNLNMKVSDLGYQRKLATEERERQKRKELRDYFMKRLEMGEYVDPAQLAAVTEGDATLEALATEAKRTGREFDSKAVTNVYENMLGAAWATKVNPKTGNTYKDEATNEVVRLVTQEKWTLEDALNRVRNAIKASPEYAAYIASQKKGGGSGAGTKIQAENYTLWDKGNGEKVYTFIDSNTGETYTQDAIPYEDPNTGQSTWRVGGTPEKGGQASGWKQITTSSAAPNPFGQMP